MIADATARAGAPPPPPPPPTVFFDVGATLIDGPDEGPGRRLARRLGLDAAAKRRLDETLLTSPFEAPDALAAALAGAFGVAAAPADAAARWIWAAQISEARPRPGAADAVRRVAAAGFRLGVISNIWRPYWESARAAQADAFAAIDAAGGDDLQLLSFREGRAKPLDELYARARERAGGGACVMIGDSYGEDIAPAARAGFRTIWLLHRPEKERAHLLALVNDAARRPDLALGDVADLTVEMLTAAGRATTAPGDSLSPMKDAG